MEYKIYSVESRKGGVGKTTIALNLAKALIDKGQDVLLIDCDITGTPITKAAEHSVFWKNDVWTEYEGQEPMNLIDFYENRYLLEDKNGEVLANQLGYKNGKIHLIGSDIYGKDGELIIDPRDLMDELHCYWFVEMIKELVDSFCKKSDQAQKAIILDNSPGYVGIGRSLRGWLANLGPERANFVLVSSLDEQDIEATIGSAVDIQHMMHTKQEIAQYVKVVINKAPEDLLEEGGGYDFKLKDDDPRKEIEKVLFPRGKNKYPQNIIKYDQSISGQFIEASLKDILNLDEERKKLYKEFNKFEKRINEFPNKLNKYGHLKNLAAGYHSVKDQLNKTGYKRMSRSLSEDMSPESFMTNLADHVRLLGNMVYPNADILEFSQDDLKQLGRDSLVRLIEECHLEPYSSIFLSLYEGMYDKAGFGKSGANIYQMLNLNIFLLGVFENQKEWSRKNDSYRNFLKNEVSWKTKTKLPDRTRLNGEISRMAHKSLDSGKYVSGLMNAYFRRFYKAYCTAVLRMIDIEQDYYLIIKACKDTIEQDAKVMRAGLIDYIRKIVVNKTLDFEKKRYDDLVNGPFEMKAIQRHLKKWVLK